MKLQIYATNIKRHARAKFVKVTNNEKSKPGWTL